jgi:hypothetical protein
VAPVAEQLKYTIRYTDVREGIADLVERYSAYLASQGKRPALQLRDETARGRAERAE